MAYYLEFGGNDHVEFAVVSILGGDDFDLNIDLRIPVASSYRIIGSLTGTTTSRVFIFSSGLVRLSSAAGVNREWSVTTPFADIESLYFSRAGGTLTLTVNGIQHPTVFNSNTDAYEFETIGTHAGFYGSPFDLYSCVFNKNSAPLRNYDPTASGGTGQILPDTVGSNDGTLVNFPTDNSQWIFYSAPSAGVDQNVTATESQQAQQSEAQAVIQAQQASAIEAQQLSQADPQIAAVTHFVTPLQPVQLNQSEHQFASVTQLLSSLDAEQITESTQQAVQLAQQIQHNEAQKNANTDTQAVILSQALQPVEAEQKAQAEQAIVQDGGGITAIDAQQQSEYQQQSITANQSVNSVEENQSVESLQATVTLAQQINAVEVEHLAQAQQSIIADVNGIVAVQVEQKAQAQVLEITQVQQVSPVNVEQQLEAEQALPTIIQRLLAVEAEQITESPTLQVSDSDIIIDPQKISVERVTPTFTIQLVERPKYTIVRL